jgi:Raf kinase inhibitor-like YbhB/YbcL family protein
MRRAVLAAAIALVAAAATMQLRSSEFSAGEVIPPRDMATDCGGTNRSPQLSWSAAPSGTKSFALIVHDPDAPVAGGFYHWVVYNLAADALALPAGATLALDQLGKNSTGEANYYGPCPPPGPAHRYEFTVYALGLAHIDAPTPLSAAQLDERIAAHVLAHALLVATASRH